MFEKIKVIIGDILEGSIETLTIESNLRDDLNADSLDAVEIVMAIEEEFGIEIPDNIVLSMKTVKDIVTYLEANI